MKDLPEPQRCCVSCRRLHSRSRLIRVVYSRLQDAFIVKFQGAQQEPFPETLSRQDLQGRSVYVCESPACLTQALKAKKLQRSLKRAIPGDILMILDKRLEGLNNSVST